MSFLFLGKFSYTIDSQRRFPFPKSWKGSYEGSFYIVPTEFGFAKIYNSKVFEEEILPEIKKYTLYGSNETSLVLSQIAQLSQLITYDKMGKISLNSNLKDFLGIKSEVIFVGNFHFAMLWAKEKWLEDKKYLPYSMNLFDSLLSKNDDLDNELVSLGKNIHKDLQKLNKNDKK